MQTPEWLFKTYELIQTLITEPGLRCGKQAVVPAKRVSSAAASTTSSIREDPINSWIHNKFYTEVVDYCLLRLYSWFEEGGEPNGGSKKGGNR